MRCRSGRGTPSEKALAAQPSVRQTRDAIVVWDIVIVL